MTTHSLPQTETELQGAISPVAIAPAFPTCPAEVDPHSTLAELRQIRTYWVQLAEHLNDFDALTTVVRELGQAFVVPFRHEPALLLKLGHLFVLYHEEVAHFDRAINNFARYEHLLVTTGNPQRAWHAGKVLARRTCRMNGSFTDEDALFIPGAWMTDIRSLYPQAEANAIARYQKAIEMDRRNLLATLCVEVL